MKAWIVGENYKYGYFLMHADTAGKAKFQTKQFANLYDIDFIDLSATRCRQLDNKPFSIENAKKVLFIPDSYPDSEQYCTTVDYTNICQCDICTKG